MFTFRSADLDFFVDVANLNRKTFKLLARHCVLLLHVGVVSFQRLVRFLKAFTFNFMSSEFTFQTKLVLIIA
jgi:hypothetical protein